MRLPLATFVSAIIAVTARLPTMSSVHGTGLIVKASVMIFNANYYFIPF